MIRSQRVSVRALVALLAAVFLFGAGYAGPPPADAARPRPTPVKSKAPRPTPTPAPRRTPAPAATPTAVPSPAATPGPSPTASGSPIATAAPRPGVPPVTTPRPAADTPAGLAPLPAGAVEVVERRTATSRTYTLADGTTASDLFTGPVYYRKKGSTAWLPIDPVFRATTGTGADAISDRGPVAIRLRDAADPSGFMTLSDDEHTVTFRLPAGATATASRARPTAAGIVGTYDEFTPGVGLRIINGTKGPKSFFVWDAPPADPSISYVVEAPGFILRPEADGSIGYVDGEGAVVGRIPQPYAVDSTPDTTGLGSGRTTDAVTLALGSDGKTITVAVDPAWLATAVYPVYVDPTTWWEYNAGSNSYGDAHNASGASDREYPDYVRPDYPSYHELWHGVTPAPGESGTSYDYLRWDLADVMGTIVESATLSVFPYHQYYNAPTTEVAYARMVTASWTEGGLNWDNKPGVTGIVTSHCTEGARCDFEVPTLVDGMLDGSNPNYGFRLDTVGETYTKWKRFIASEQGNSNIPKLTVEYHSPISAVYPTGGGKTSATTLTWTAEGSWASGSEFRVQVATADTFAAGTVVADSFAIASSATSWAIPVALTPGTPYYWRVKVENGTASPKWSIWSPTASFIYDLGNLGLQSQHATEGFDLAGGDGASVNVSTGNLVLSHSVLALPIRGSSVTVEATYNSGDPADVGLGVGWRLNTFRRLTVNGNTVTFTDADGARSDFTNPVVNGTVTTYDRPHALFATLRKDTSQANPFTLTYRDRSVDTFDAAGVLRAEADRHGNGVTFGYSGSNLVSISDTAGGRSYSLTWTSGHVTSITDWVNVNAAGVVQASGTGNRTTRFFYSGSTLLGWADPLNTTGSCPTGGSHLTCLAHGTNTLTISKWQTQTTLAGGVLGASAPLRRDWVVSMAGREVTAVQDPTQSTAQKTVFERKPGALVWVTRMVFKDKDNQSHPLVAEYTLKASSEPYGRVASVARDRTGANILTTTTYGNASFPTLPTQVVEDAVTGRIARTTTTTYIAGARGLGLVSRTEEPLAGSTERWTDYTYNANDDVVQVITSQDGSTSHRTVSRTCYDTACSLTATGNDPVARIENYVAGGPSNSHTNVRTDYTYTTSPATGLLLTETRHNRSGSGNPGVFVDDRVTAYAYDEGGPAYGLLTSMVENQVGGGLTATANVTTRYAYDSAGNQVAVADPRRALAGAGWTTTPLSDYVTSSTFDALGNEITSVAPTTPAGTGVDPCSPDPACRTTSSAYDEFGNLRLTAEPTEPGSPNPHPGRVSATRYDALGRALETYEDPSDQDPAVITGATGYDASGRATWTKDEAEALTPGDPLAAGSTVVATVYAYDARGNQTMMTEAANSSLPAQPPTVRLFEYDALDRKTRETNGTATVNGSSTNSYYTYDLGGRVTQTDDRYACTTASFDWADRQTGAILGRTPPTSAPGTCTGTGTRTLALAYDGLGRQLSSTVTAGTGSGDVITSATYDSAGRTLATSSATAGQAQSTTASHDILDRTITDDRTNAGGVVTKYTYDIAGNGLATCTWTAGMTVGACPPGANPPATFAAHTYDALNSPVTFSDGTGSTIAYDPLHGYAVAAEYLHVGDAGSTVERGRHYGYDSRDRVISITDVVCSIAQRPCVAPNITSSLVVNEYLYDENDNRTKVVERVGSSTTTRFYCYDDQDQLIGAGSAADCSGTGAESHTFDAAGNRLTAPVSGGTRTFAYQGGAAPDGLLSGASGGGMPAATVTYLPTGNVASITDGVTWVFEYDGQGRMTRACKTATACSTSVDRLDFTYDAGGNRTRIIATPAMGTATTTTFRYEGGLVASEVEVTGSTTITRTFTAGPDGAVAKMVLATTPTPGANDGTYLVRWNGHGDAIGLERITTATGALTPVTSWTYSTWGTPTRSGLDLGFRYLYVGSADVQWDDQFSLGLAFMHARHYSPSLGRFLQPDPARADASTYRYGVNNPVVRTDPSGLGSPPAGKPGMSSHEIGLRGEREVRAVLEKLGWKVEGTQVRYYNGARIVDIKASLGRFMVIVEVKSNGASFHSGQRGYDRRIVRFEARIWGAGKVASIEVRVRVPSAGRPSITSARKAYGGRGAVLRGLPLRLRGGGGGGRKQ